MQPIEIDFDVYKELTIRRKNESVTYNDVIRELLGLSNIKQISEQSKSTSNGFWLVKGIKFPEGTDFRANYKGILHIGKVVKNLLHVNGKYYSSPSSAAVAITGNAVNGWNFWEVRLPNQLNWKIMNSFRNIPS